MNELHILTAWLPLLFMVPGLFLLITGWMGSMEKMKKVSFILFLLAGLSAILTCLLGLISMPAAKNDPSVDTAALHIHAWSALGALLFAAVITFFSFQTLRRKEKPDNTSLLMMVLISLLVIAFLVFTMRMAYRVTA